MKFSRKKSDLVEILMISPPLIGFLLFMIGPILWVLGLSFYGYDGVTRTFLGFTNFARALSDELFWLSVANTFLFLAAKLLVEVPLALVLALILQTNPRGSTLFRVVFFMPTMISAAIIGLIFYFIFASYEGIVNGVLVAMHLVRRPINWFDNRWKGLFVITSASIWQWLGFNMVLFLAGLQSISPEMYEASKLEGASKSQNLFMITLPLLAPTIQVIILLSITGCLALSDVVLTLTGGGPAGQTDTMMSFIFKLFFPRGAGAAIGRPAYGYGSALSMLVTFIITGVSVVYLAVSRRLKDVY
jgi:raffinose/stachyose/melibiose transport system permease protein